jgi:hypothetical protein
VSEAELNNRLFLGKKARRAAGGALLRCADNHDGHADRRTKAGKLRQESRRIGEAR